MGMVRVCCSSAAVVGVLCETIRSGCSAMSSFADRCINAASEAVQRMSMRMSQLSAHPSFRSSSRNAATNACRSASLSDPAISTPIRRSSCCALSGSGPATAIPPASVMKSRRLMSDLVKPLHRRVGNMGRRRMVAGSKYSGTIFPASLVSIRQSVSRSRCGCHRQSAAANACFRVGATHPVRLW